MRNVLFGAIALTFVLASTTADACRCAQMKAQAKQQGKSGVAHAGCGGAGGCGASCGGACGAVTAKPTITRTTHELESVIEWTDLESALKQAHEQDRLLLVRFSFGKQCAHCVKLEQELFRQAEVAALLNAGDRVIPVQVPLWAMTPDERLFAEKVGYDEDCLLALVDANGEVVQSNSGQSFSTRGVPSAAALVAMLSVPGE